MSSNTILQNTETKMDSPRVSLAQEGETRPESQVPQTVENMTIDSRLERTRLNDIFMRLENVLYGRQMVFGRSQTVNQESTSLKGKLSSLDWADHISETDISGLIVDNLCLVTGCPRKKINEDILRVPFLHPADLQTSSELKLKRKGPKKVESDAARKRWVERIVGNIRGIVFGIWDLTYSVCDRVLNLELFSEFIVIWTVLFMQGRFAKLWKLQTTLLFCMATGQQEEPEYSESDIFPFRKGFLAGGKFFRFIRKMKLQPKEIHVPFFYSLMQTKRCSESLSWKDELASLVKHKKNMTGAAFKGLEKPGKVQILAFDDDWNEVPKEVPQDFGTVGETTTLACEKIERIIKKNMRRARKVAWRPPSINSTFTHSRKSCGAQGWFTQFFGDLRPVFIGYIEEGWKPVPVYSPLSLVEEVYEFYEYLRLQDQEFIQTPLIQLCAQVHTVLEPLKARIITSGDAPVYHWARMLQKSIHGALRKDEYMKLMGLRHSQELFTSQFAGKIIPKGWFWVAGDYDAATDGMNPTVSLGYCDSVGRAMKLNDLEIKRLKSTMTGHLIHYPEWAVEKAAEIEVDLSPVTQTWGQLMGSPSSFPALCTINMAGFWVACERYEGRELSYKDLEKYCVMVNGDDIVFISDDRLYQIWKETMTELGLTPSIGKNFQSRDWMMINSTCYWISYGYTVEDWEKVWRGEMSKEEMFGTEPTEVRAIVAMNHVDPGLIAGKSKVQSDTRREEMSELDEDAQLFATSAKLKQAISHLDMYPEQAERMVESFMYHNGNALKRSKRSWTLPDTLGGLGLPGNCNTSTIRQKLVALRVAGLSWFDPEEVIQNGLIQKKIDLRLKLSKPQTEKGDAIPVYLLPQSLMNDRTSANLGFKVPDLSHLELSSSRELSEGALFERTLRQAEREAEGIDLSFFGMLDFNKLANFSFQNEESRVSIRPSFPTHIKWNPKCWTALSEYGETGDVGELNLHPNLALVH